MCLCATGQWLIRMLSPCCVYTRHRAASWKFPERQPVPRRWVFPFLFSKVAVFPVLQSGGKSRDFRCVWLGAKQRPYLLQRLSIEHSLHVRYVGEAVRCPGQADVNNTQPRPLCCVH